MLQIIVVVGCVKPIVESLCDYKMTPCPNKCHRRNKWNERCFRPRFRTCKAILVRGPPELMRWILLWIMPLVHLCHGTLSTWRHVISRLIGSFIIYTAYVITPPDWFIYYLHSTRHQPHNSQQEHVERWLADDNNFVAPRSHGNKVLCCSLRPN